MPDTKYGRIFTESDLEKVFEQLGDSGVGNMPDLGNVLSHMDEEGVRFKFGDPDEPLFVLRGRDKRAIGALRFYQDHQSPRAPQNHLDGIDRAVDTFERYRHHHANQMKEPD